MYLGIDIGGTRLKAGFVDAGGRMIRSASAAFPATREELEHALPALVSEVLAGDLPRAAGFGCKGVVNTLTTEIQAIPGQWHFMEGMRLSDVLYGILPEGTPVAADNDAKSALAGEVSWGAARGRKNVLLLTLGTGVGGAILADGKILRGATDVAGHLGHICADPDGPPCMCGSRGCLETVFSARAIEAAAWSAMHQGCASPMTDALRANPQMLTCRFVFDQATKGDPVARGILDRKIRLLGAALAGILHLLDPEVVVIGGNIAEAGAALFEPLRREVDWRVQGLLHRAVPLTPPGVSDTSGIVGAAALARLLIS